MARCQKTGIKKELLEAGMKIMQEKGYTNGGLQQVLDAVGVPKGSFYHYFESKEVFALEIIQHYDCNYTEAVLSCLRDPSHSPLERMRNYCLAGREKVDRGSCTSGCLIGNLSQEMASQSERLREKLDEVFIRWRDLFAAAIEEGQAWTEIDARYAPVELAEIFLSGWEGALLRAKSTQSTGPIDNFIKLVFGSMAIPREKVRSPGDQSKVPVFAPEVDQILGRLMPRV
jgi:TetR/AcrR family transcriptional repressor of nem operon